MRKRRTWLWLGLGLLLMGLTFAGVYEYQTHVLRGWLCGEAFFDGRPTSYWRLRCDEWLERMQDAGSLTHMTLLLPYEIPGHQGFRMWVPHDEPIPGGGIAMPRETTWKRITDSLGSKEDLERNCEYRFAPKVLWGSPDTEPVLLALAQEEKYRELSRLALKRVKGYHELKKFLDKEAMQSAP